MPDLIKPWQDHHLTMHLTKILECTVTAVGKDSAGVHTLMVHVDSGNHRLPYKIVTRSEDFPQGIPPGYINVGHVLEVLYSSIDDTARTPVLTPVEILNKTHEGGDILHFKTKKMYDSAAKTRDFDPWEDYLKDVEALRRGEFR